MNKLFEILESRGLISEDDIGKVDDLPKRKLVALYESVYSTVFAAQYPDTDLNVSNSPDLDPFSFMASASMRADSGCLEPVCRMRKLDFLARFAALYANHVTLPLPLEHPDKASSIDRSRDDLIRTLMSIFALRPLVENGIVRPVTMRTMHCEHVTAFVDEMQSFVHSAADWGAKEFLSDFEITFQLPEESPSGRSTVYVDGPEELLDHGSIVALFDEGPSWRAKSWKYDDEGKTILKGKRKLLFVEQIFNTIANDTTFYLASGLQHRSRLLTDRPGEAFLLSWLNPDKELQATSQAMEFLSHSIPLLADIPLSTVLRIRREERDSFESYRRAITSLTTEVLAENGSLSIEAAKDAFKAKLGPQIEKVKAEVTAERARQARRLAVGIPSLTAAVLIGAWGALPILIKGVLGVAGTAVGTKLLSKFAESKCEHGADLRQKSDLYFLLRMMEE
jgi:hypothetical protein